MVDRYDQGDYCGGEYQCDMEKSKDGEYVKYEDYRELQGVVNGWLNWITYLSKDQQPKALIELSKQFGVE